MKEKLYLDLIDALMGAIAVLLRMQRAGMDAPDPVRDRILDITQEAGQLITAQDADPAPAPTPAKIKPQKKQKVVKKRMGGGKMKSKQQKWTAEKVQKVRNLVASGKTDHEIAAYFGSTYFAVQRVRSINKILREPNKSEGAAARVLAAKNKKQVKSAKEGILKSEEKAEQHAAARKAAAEHGANATKGKVPVRIDKRTVVYATPGKEEEARAAWMAKNVRISPKKEEEPDDDAGAWDAGFPLELND